MTGQVWSRKQSRWIDPAILCRLHRFFLIYLPSLSANAKFTSGLWKVLGQVLNFKTWNFRAKATCNCGCNWRGGATVCWRTWTLQYLSLFPPFSELAAIGGNTVGPYFFKRPIVQWWILCISSTHVDIYHQGHLYRGWIEELHPRFVYT